MMGWWGIGVLMAASALAGTPTLVNTARVPGASDVQGVAIAGDGTIYVAGNTAEQTGFVARYNADGSRQLARCELAGALVTTVAVNSNGAYVGGYATEGLPIASKYPLAVTNAPIPKLPDGHETPKSNRVPTPRPGLGRRGAPFVVRLPATLARVEGGRYLEGWQQVWDVPRERGYQREWAWQPTGIGFLTNGDVIVSHDGGYDLGLTVRTPQEGKENFNHVCDYVSRLSPDLKDRAWRKDIYTPLVNREALAKLRPWWKHDHYGNPRTLRLRTDGRDHIYIAGWSASATAKEPWWTPFLWKLDAAGNVVWKAYSPDPLSGDNNRVNGLVSDAGVSSVALDEAGNVIATTIGDGGNSILRRDPLDWRKPAGPELKGTVYGFKGRILYWGTVARLDGQTGSLLAGNHISASSEAAATVAAWGIDAAALPGGRVLVAGRFFDRFRFTSDAWQTNNPGKVTSGFLRVYSAECDVKFSTAVTNFIPFEVARQGARAVIAGKLGEAGALLVADFPE
jgi:hypothetical protein